MSVENSGTWESKDDVSVEVESHTLRRHTQTHRERFTHTRGGEGAQTHRDFAHTRGRKETQTHRERLAHTYGEGRGADTVHRDTSSQGRGHAKPKLSGLKSESWHV